MIKLEHVSKSYNKGAVQAVKDLSLTVESGELFGFLGPNGAGKTTTIKMIIGLLRPDSGTIEMNGINVVHNARAAKAMIGYVSDEPLLYEKMTGAAFLRFVADMYEVSDADRSIVSSLADEFEMSDALGNVVSSYSHGMKQKLSVMAALLHDPDVFILDEPIVGLDPRASFLLKEKMKERCAAGKTVFFSTHVMEVAEKLCDRVGIIRNGRIIAIGPLSDLRSRSKNEKGSLEQIFLELTDEDVVAR